MKFKSFNWFSEVVFVLKGRVQSDKRSLKWKKNKKLQNVCHCHLALLNICLSACWLSDVVTEVLKKGLRPHRHRAFWWKWLCLFYLFFAFSLFFGGNFAKKILYNLWKMKSWLRTCRRTSRCASFTDWNPQGTLLRRSFHNCWDECSITMERSWY